MKGGILVLGAAFAPHNVMKTSDDPRSIATRLWCT